MTSARNSVYCKRLNLDTMESQSRLIDCQNPRYIWLRYINRLSIRFVFPATSTFRTTPNLYPTYNCATVARTMLYIHK